MKKLKILVIVFFIFNNYSNAQWIKSDGPKGAYTDEIIKTETALILSATNGGVYKSIDNGENWLFKSSGLPLNEGVVDLVAHKGNLYASMTRDGIYWSTDEAESWVAINNGIDFITFYNILVTDSEIYAGAANGGIYYSSDNGDNWQKKSDGISEIQFNDFAVFNSSVYAAGSSLFKTIDSGETWEKVEIPGIGPNGIRSMVVSESSL